MTAQTDTPTEAGIGHQRDTDAVEKRVNRALGSIFHVEEGNSAGEYTVHSSSGNSYTVTMPDGDCTCPDGQRGPWCKHAHRVAFTTGELPEIDGVKVVTGDDESAENDGDNGDDGDDDDEETLADRVERYVETNPDASAIEVLSQLGINPDEKGRVEEILA
jgi:hypothetical protein